MLVLIVLLLSVASLVKFLHLPKILLFLRLPPYQVQCLFEYLLVCLIQLLCRFPPLVNFLFRGHLTHFASPLDQLTD